MTPAEHYQEAERLLAAVTNHDETGRAWYGRNSMELTQIQAAQVHATLAMVTLEAAKLDHWKWQSAPSRPWTPEEARSHAQSWAEAGP